jgi:phosphate transport system protein
MSFGSILDLFKQDNWSNKLVGRVNEMLELGSDMFAYTTGVLLDGNEDNAPQTLLYDRDKRINHLERSIRRRVVSHLSMGQKSADIPSALIFTNVVKDGERIGDYVKNLHEVAGMMPENPDRELYVKWLSGPTEAVSELFQLTRQAFAESDPEMAGKVIKTAQVQGKSYEEMIREVTTSDLATNDAVCLVLVLRFYKRLVAHMSNIASTVVMPVDMIDFYDEDEI